MSLGNVLIFGDSYSTFKGFIPQGYVDYYRPEGNPKTDLLHVEETWWHRLITKTESTLLLNDSWSGSTVCNTGYNGDCSKTNSFIVITSGARRKFVFIRAISSGTENGFVT